MGQLYATLEYQAGHLGITAEELKAEALAGRVPYYSEDGELYFSLGPAAEHQLRLMFEQRRQIRGQPYQSSSVE